MSRNEITRIREMKNKATDAIEKGHLLGTQLKYEEANKAYYIALFYIEANLEDMLLEE
jgi:hypothetical protein